MTVKQLIKKLSKMPQDAKIVLYNDNTYINGMYYVTNVSYDETMGEPQVEIETEHEKIAKVWKGWE